MGIWSWFLGKDEPITQPSIRLGRYSDSYKLPENYEAWEKSLQAFERNDFMECCRQFLIYLRDKKEDNVQWKEQDGTIEAALIQGSQKVTIKATSEYFNAATHIAKADGLNIGLMRRLLEQNVHLNYGHYALSPDNEITVIFTTHALDGSPYKLYYALKEISTISDKQDNLLIDEFKSLQIVDETLRGEMPAVEKETRYNYVVDTLKERFDLLDNIGLNFEQHPKAASYVLFDALFRVDYLTCPEGFVMEVIERAFRKFNENDGKNIIQKNIHLKKEIQEILNRPKSEHIRELYNITSTFGITTSVAHERLLELIDEHYKNADWYEKNNFPAIAQAIYGYIVGFSFFSYALPKIDQQALALYYQVVEEPYFQALGFSSRYLNADGSVEKTEVEKRLLQISNDSKAKFPKAKFDTSILDCSDLTAFSRTFLQLLTKLDMSS
jgi:hypothetical protein